MQTRATEKNTAAIDVVKGVLILVVIAGHNEAITQNNLWLRQLFYYFNVQCFFLLSSLLDTKPFTWSLIRDRAVRYLVPYATFMLLAWVAFLGLRSNATDAAAAYRNLAWAFWSGSEPAIQAAVGMRYLWFLPALFSLVLVKSLAARGTGLRALLLATSVAWIAYTPLIPRQLLSALPLGLGTGLFFFGVGELLRECIGSAFPVGRPVRGSVAALLTVALSMLIVRWPLGWVAGANITSYDPRLPLTWSVALVYPCAMLVALLDAAAHARGTGFLAACGRYSLPMYLIHMLLYRGLTRIWFGPAFDSLATVGSDLAAGVVIFVLTTAGSLMLAALVWRFGRLRRIIFPRDWAEWCGACGCATR